MSTLSLSEAASLGRSFFPKSGFFVDFLYITLISLGGNYKEMGGGMGGRARIAQRELLGYPCWVIFCHFIEPKAEDAEQIGDTLRFIFMSSLLRCNCV
jgi:hypothetical protein